MSGWGKNSFGKKGTFESKLKHVDVPIISQGECQAKLRAKKFGKNFQVLANSLICAGGEQNEDTCTVSTQY
jgi:hypothetical protein